MDERLERVITMVRAGVFGPPQDSKDLMDGLESTKDFYLLGYDWPSYLEALDAADAVYRNQAGSY